MRVRILNTLPYSDFSGGRVGAKEIEAGEVVSFPNWYAESLIASGHAEGYSEPTATEDVEVQVEVEIDATNAAMELALEAGVDLSAVIGTGRDGRIVISDVRKAMEG